MIDLFVVLFGLIVGSFLTVCIYRIPLGRGSGLTELTDDEEQLADAAVGKEGEAVTVASPRRSFCPHCKTQLLLRYNIPVVGYLLQLGRCTHCKEKISLRYPLVEILSACSAWFCYASFEPLTAITAYIFVAALIVISFIDLEYFIIPNVISYPGVAFGVLIGVEQEFFGALQSPPFVGSIEESLWGILTGAGILFSISFFYIKVRKKQGLGLGDVKLLAATGATFGVQGAFYTIFIGSLLGSVLGISLILIGRGKWSSYIPFGPYLAVANILFLFSAHELLGLAAPLPGTPLPGAYSGGY
ncbi:prepilin peptidase [bacterium]|nr:prepilin peptidase [bacterium]